MSCDEISADWAAQRIKGLNLSAAVIDGLKRSLGLNKKSAAAELGQQGGVKTLIESFRYPRKGPGMMWETAAKKIEAMGGQIVMDTALERLRFDTAANQWIVSARNRAEGETTEITAAHVISSAPITELVGSIDPRPDCAPPGVGAALSRLHHRGADHPQGVGAGLLGQLDLPSTIRA